MDKEHRKSVSRKKEQASVPASHPSHQVSNSEMIERLKEMANQTKQQKEES